MLFSCVASADGTEKKLEDMVGIILLLTIVASLWHERDLEIHMVILILKQQQQNKPIYLLTYLQFMISCHQS